MDTGHYDNEEDDPSVNGWIKKEIDEDEFEDYIKQVPEMESGDRYEELMHLTKDDLIGRILQQEEDIRYLQDLRHGMEKNIQDLTSSCSEFKKLLGDMSSILSNSKEPQPVVSSPSPTQPIPQVSRVQAVPRSGAGSSSAQASPRSTPNPFSSSSPRPSSNPGSMSIVPSTRAGANASSVPQPTHIASSITTTDRMHAGKTVTITRSTNVVIKTEIPSPPPDQPMMTQQTLNNPVASVGVQRNKQPENQRPYHTRQQSQRNNVVPPMSSSSSMPFSQPTAAYVKAPNQSGNVSVQSRQQPAQRGRPSNPQVHVQNTAPNRGAANQMQRNVPNAFQRQQQQRVMQANVSQSQANVASGGGHKTQAAFNTPVSRQQASMPNAPAANMSRQRSTPQQPVPTSSPATVSKCTVTEITDNAPVKMPSGITLPSGLTLSIVMPKCGGGPEPKAHLQQSGGEKAMMSSGVAKIPFNQENSVSSEDGSAKNSDKNILSSNISNTSAVSTTTATPMEEDEDEEEFYDEVAVLEPDKSSSPPMELAGGQGGDGQVSSGGSEGFARPIEQSPESYWNAQNAPVRNDQKSSYQNNDEYMYEETDDIDSGEENDSKVYLGEDVTLPKDLVDSCMKQGPTPAKLTRNLMQALFPDLREIASGCNDGGDSNSSGPSLPSNKLNAIIAQVQKVYPQAKRSQIVLTMNMKCREARTQLTKNRRTHVQYSPY